MQIVVHSQFFIASMAWMTVAHFFRIEGNAVHRLHNRMWIRMIVWFWFHWIFKCFYSLWLSMCTIYNIKLNRKKPAFGNSMHKYADLVSVSQLFGRRIVIIAPNADGELSKQTVPTWSKNKRLLIWLKCAHTSFTWRQFVANTMHIINAATNPFSQ